MAYNDDDMRNAEKLFCIEGMKLEDIEKTLKIPYSTLNRWKKEKKWQDKRDACNFSYAEIEGILVKKMQKIILDVENDKIDFLDPGVADALVKNISVIQKLNPSRKMYGLILTFIKKTDDYLSKTDPKLREKMMEHWDGIRETLQVYLENGK